MGWHHLALGSARGCRVQLVGCLRIGGVARDRGSWGCEGSLVVLRRRRASGATRLRRDAGLNEPAWLHSASQAFGFRS